MPAGWFSPSTSTATSTLYRHRRRQRLSNLLATRFFGPILTMDRCLFSTPVSMQHVLLLTSGKRSKCCFFGSPVCVLLPKHAVGVLSSLHTPCGFYLHGFTKVLIHGPSVKKLRQAPRVIYLYESTKSSYVWGAPSNQSKLVNHGIAYEKK